MLAIDCMEEGTMVLDWNPEKYKTKAGAAKGLYKALCKWCKALGMKPDIEIHIYTPEQTEARGYGKFWNVSFEAGPFEWAVHASLQMPHCKWGYCEPYYSFDLHFVE